MDVTLLIKPLESGQVEASVLELPAYRVEAASRELAIATLQTELLEKMKDAEVLDWSIPMKKKIMNSPWLKFAGIFENSTDFADIMTEIQAERDYWGDEEMDESEYIR